MCCDSGEINFDDLKELKSFLCGAICEIQSTLPTYSGMKYDLGLKCDLCLQESNRCDRHQMEGCTNEDCVHLLRLEDLENGKNTCDRNLHGERDFSELSKCAWINQAGKNEDQ